MAVQRTSWRRTDQVLFASPLHARYGKWVQAGMMDDYIMIDFCSTVPIMKLGNKSSQLRRQSFIRIADLKCLYVVSTDGWQSMTIHNPELNKISNTWLLHD